MAYPRRRRTGSAGGQIVTMDDKAHYIDAWDLLIAHPPYDHIEDLLNEDFSDTGKSEPNSYTMTFTLPEEVHEAMDKYIDENPAGKVELAQLLVNKAKGLI